MIGIERQHKLKNWLLANMQPELFSALAPHLEPVSLPRGYVIEAANEVISEVCFPGPGVISVVAIAESGIQLEAGLIGPEGMSGLSLVNGVDRTPHASFVQIPCRALCISAENFQQVLADNRLLHRYLLRYSYAFQVQVAQTALSGAHFTIEQRLARWLVMVHDRLDREDVMLTQEFLSIMLGVRRAGITTALRNLVALGAVNIHRGTIMIQDRALLLSTAAEAYGLPEATYAAVMGTHSSDFVC